MDERILSVTLDPAEVFTAAGLVPDPWQADVLRSANPRILLCCTRQAGKSTTIAALACHRAIAHPNSMILLISRAQRQSSELFRKCIDFYNVLGRPFKPVSESALQIQLQNGSRIVALPGNEANLRAYSAVNLLVIDEAARVPDDLYRSVRPMLAVSGGRCVILSTPFGRRGFFWNEWSAEESSWQKVRVTADQIARIKPEFLQEERRTLGISWYRQEYECSFESLEGLVYPDFERCLVDDYTLSWEGKFLGGIDWGWHNPFAAINGILDKHDVLWITNERYERNCPLSTHAKHLPRHTTWYCDPAGRTELEELRAAGFLVHAGDNSLRAGIAAVTARIQTGRLKVSRWGCPNLIAEASLYRYPRPDERTRQDEVPIDDNNHALAALRYLISRVDRRFMARVRKGQGPGKEAREDLATEKDKSDYRPVPRAGKSADPMDERLWTPLD